MPQFRREAGEAPRLGNFLLSRERSVDPLGVIMRGLAHPAVRLSKPAREGTGDRQHVPPRAASCRPGARG